MGFMKENLGKKLSAKEYAEVREAILKQGSDAVNASLQFAGGPARKTNVCAYNCSFVAPSKLRDFGEIMYVLMCGTGAGFAVESKNVQALPQIKAQTGGKFPTYIIDDSREGWADALTHGLTAWYGGNDVSFDFSNIRPAGARLNTMGGHASGPEPLRSLLDFARTVVLKNKDAVFPILMCTTLLAKWARL